MLCINDLYNALFDLLAAEKSWMKNAPLKGGDHGELTENWSRRKEHFENLSILADLEMMWKSYKMTMLHLCNGDERLSILKM